MTKDLQAMFDKLKQMPEGLAVRIPYDKVYKAARPSHRIKDFQDFMWALHLEGIEYEYIIEPYKGYRLYRK